MNNYRVKVAVLSLMKAVGDTAYIKAVDAREDAAASRFG